MSNDNNAAGQSEGEVADASIRTEDQPVTDLEQVPEQSGDTELEAELVVKKVEVLGTIDLGAPPALVTEEPSSAAGPLDDRTEDQVTELEDDKLLVKMSNLSGPSLEDVANIPEDIENVVTSVAEDVVPAPASLEYDGGLTQLEIQLEDKPLLLSTGDSIPVESVSDVKSDVDESSIHEVSYSFGAAVAQGELQLPEQASFDVSEVSAVEEDTVISEIGSVIVDSFTEEASSVKTPKVDEVTSKISTVNNKLIQLTHTVEELSAQSDLSEDKSVKKMSVSSKPDKVSEEKPSKKISVASKAEEIVEEKPIKKISVSSKAEEEKPSKKISVSSKPDEIVEEKVLKKISVSSKPEEIVEEKPHKKISVSSKAEEEKPSKKISVSSKPEDVVDEKPLKKISVSSKPEEDKSSRKGSLTNKLIELTPSIAEEPLITVAHVGELGATSVDDTKEEEAQPEAVIIEQLKSPTDKTAPPLNDAEPPKKKDRFSSKYDQPVDKASKFGGRAKKSVESKSAEEPAKAPRSKKSSTAKEPEPEAVQQPEAAIIEQEPEATIIEPEVEPAGSIIEPEIQGVIIEAEQQGPEGAIVEPELAADIVEPGLEEAPETEKTSSIEEETLKQQETEETPVKKPSVRKRYSPIPDEPEKPTVKKDYESKPPSGTVVERPTYSSSSSYPSTKETISAGRYSSQASYTPQSATRKPDYLPQYRHTPSYVSTFDNLVNISSFSQNLWPLEHSRSRSRIRNRSRNQYQSPSRDYSLPASLHRAPSYTSGNVSRSTSSSSLMGYVDHKNFELRRDHSRSQLQDSYPLVRSSTTRIYGGTPPAESINHWYNMQESSVNHFVNKINEPLASYHYKNTSYYQPAYTSYSRGYSFEKPPPSYGSSYSSSYGSSYGSYGSSGRPYYPSYESRPFLSGLRTSRYDTNESRYYPSYYQPSSFSRGFALTSGPLMSRSGYW